MRDPFCLTDLKEEEKRILAEIILDYEVGGDPSDLVEMDSPDCYLFGDIHGDLHTVDGAMRILKDKKARDIIFLGDIIDRSDIENGGLLTLIYILLLRSHSGMNISIIRGNHEGYNLLEFFPYELPYEVQSYFHPEEDHPVYRKILEIFDELPLALVVNGRIIAAHSGFPKKFKMDRTEPLGKREKLSFMWGEPVEYGIPRGPISYQVNFHHNDFRDFMELNDLDLFIRGHDFNIKGCSVYVDRFRTVFSCGKYASRGNQGTFLGQIRRIGDRSEIGLMDFKDGKLQEIPFKSLDP